MRRLFYRVMNRAHAKVLVLRSILEAPPDKIRNRFKRAFHLPIRQSPLK